MDVAIEDCEQFMSVSTVFQMNVTDTVTMTSNELILVTSTTTKHTSHRLQYRFCLLQRCIPSSGPMKGNVFMYYRIRMVSIGSSFEPTTRAIVWRSSKVQSIETKVLERIITWMKTNLSLFSAEPNYSLSIVDSSVLKQEQLSSFLKMSITNPHTCRSCSRLRAEKTPRESQCAERQCSDEFHRTDCLTSSIWSSEPSWSHLARDRL